MRDLSTGPPDISVPPSKTSVYERPLYKISSCFSTSSSRTSANAHGAKARTIWGTQDTQRVARPQVQHAQSTKRDARPEKSHAKRQWHFMSKMSATLQPQRSKTVFFCTKKIEMERWLTGVEASLHHLWITVLLGRLQAQLSFYPQLFLQGVFCRSSSPSNSSS